jgi:TonB family protein
MRPAFPFGDARPWRALPARRAAKRWGVAATASFLLHAAVAGAAWGWRDAWDIYLVAPQAGRASIALTASFAAQPEAPPVELAPPAPAPNSGAPAEATHTRLEPTESAIMRLDPAEPESALRLLAPVEPVIVVSDDAATLVMVGGVVERNEASLDTLPPAGESESPRPLARRRLELEPALPSAVSVPAPSAVDRSGVDTENPPRPLVNPPPVYPPEALAAGRTGRVIVRAEIALDGKVREARVQESSGVASLDRAALAAVREWRFSAAADPQTPPRRVDVPIDFVIRRAAPSASAGASQ